MGEEKLGENTIIVKNGEDQKMNTFLRYLKGLLAEDIKSKKGTEIFHALTSLEIPGSEMLLTLLKDPDEDISMKLAQYLIVSGNRSLGILEAALRDESCEIRKKTIHILGQIASPEAIRLLVQYLGNEYNDLALTVVEELKSIGSKCVPFLIEAFNAPDPKLRNYIAYALSGIGDPRANEKLIAALSDQDPDICGTAAMALGQPGNLASARVLTRVLIENGKRIRKYKEAGNPKSFTFTGVQAHIAAALVKVGAVAVPLLTEQMKTLSDKDILKVIISILGKIASPEAVAVLIAIATHHEKVEPKLLIEVLAALESAKDPLCIKVLSEILESKGKEKAVYEATMKSLQVIPGVKAEQSLIAAMRHSESAIRFYAIIALEARKSVAAIPAVFALIKDASPLVVARAKTFLERLGLQSLPVLFEIISQNSAGSAAASDLIKRIGENAIKKLQKDGSETKQEYIQALQLIVERAATLPGTKFPR